MTTLQRDVHGHLHGGKQGCEYLRAGDDGDRYTRHPLVGVPLCIASPVGCEDAHCDEHSYLGMSPEAVHSAVMRLHRQGAGALRLRECCESIGF